MVAGAIGVDDDAVLREGDLFGCVLESFVAAQLRAEAVFSDCRPRLYHLRIEQGRQEFDLLAEIGAGTVIGIEVKATNEPNAATAEHLKWLRDQLGERFLAGVVLHTGPRPLQLAERITAVPISTLWAESLLHQS